MGEPRSTRVVIRGRVQGVFFRVGCAERARAAGVTGWVRNRPDGSVEALLQGEATAVEAVLAWCRTGPPGARVDAIDVVPTPASQAASFTIEP